MSELTAEQTEVMSRVREHATALAATINEAETVGIGPAYLLPELITILRESGFSIPNIPLGLFG